MFFLACGCYTLLPVSLLLVSPIVEVYCQLLRNTARQAHLLDCLLLCLCFFSLFTYVDCATTKHPPDKSSSKPGTHKRPTANSSYKSVTYFVNWWVLNDNSSLGLTPITGPSMDATSTPKT